MVNAALRCVYESLSQLVVYTQRPRVISLFYLQFNIIPLNPWNQRMNMTSGIISNYTDSSQSQIITENLLSYISKIAETGTDSLAPQDILQHQAFDSGLLEKLKRDEKLQRLEGMLNGSRNFVVSQERRNNTVYSPPERVALFLKNLRSSLPSLYAEKKESAAPSPRVAKIAETLEPITYQADMKSLSDEAFLDQYFLRGALCDLMERLTEKLDPVNGDAACQLRVPFVLDASAAMADFLSAEAISDAELTALIEKFRSSNGLHIDSEQLPPLQILRLRWQNESLALADILKRGLAHLQQTLGNNGKIDVATYLALSKALTQTQIAYVDDFGLPAIRVNLTIYRDQQELDKRKVALAEIARDYLLILGQKLTNIVTPAHNLAAQAFETLKLSTAELPLGKGRRIPCLPMYPGLLTVLLHEKTNGRPLVVHLKRLEFWRAITPHSPDTPTIRYRLNGAGVYCFTPDSEGNYRLSVGDQPDLDAKPALCIDAWSMIDLDGDAPAAATSALERDLYSPDYVTFQSAFLRCDITGLILASAAAHAPLPGVARAADHPEGWEDCGRAYVNKLITQTSGEAPQPGPAQRHGIDLICDGVDDAARSLSGEYHAFLKYLESRNQFELIYNMPVDRQGRDERQTIYRRIARNVPFTPIHIYASTLGVKRAECAALTASKRANRQVGQEITFENSLLPSELLKDFK